MAPPQPAVPTPPQVPVIIGTAGHIDHGKSSLVKALTGTDPDRLKEEKERGITIELGFAFLTDDIAFIDVPGHERFVKHMVAGAATVDYALLVVAADDGVMPQTREHLDILTLLDVRGGLVALTKADLADADMLELVRDDVRSALAGSALEGVPILEVDSLSGRGIPALRAALLELAAGKRVKGGAGGFRMPIDRVFTLKGFGTVVTGSVLSGAAAVDDRLVLQPRGVDVRVRGLHSHSRTVPRVVAGQRAAINLASLGVDDVSRGDVLASEGLLSPTTRLRVRVDVLRDAPVPLADRLRVHVHAGTAELTGRVYLLEPAPIPPGGHGYAELRLEQPTAVRRLDRLVLRRFSPVTPLAGAVILDANPPRGRQPRAALREAVRRLDAPDAGAALLPALEAQPFATLAQLAAALGEPAEAVAPRVDDLLLAGELFAFGEGAGARLYPATHFERSLQAARSELAAFHDKNPLRAGMGRGELASRLNRLVPAGMAAAVVARAVQVGALAGPSPEAVALPGFEVQLTRRQRDQVATIEGALQAGALTPPSLDDLAQAAGITPKEARVLLTYLADCGRVRCLEGTLYFAEAHLQGARPRLAELFARQPEATASELREHLASTRKYAIPLLEHFDGRRWTVRDGDVRRAGPELAGDQSPSKRASTESPA